MLYILIFMLSLILTKAIKNAQSLAIIEEKVIKTI